MHLREEKGWFSSNWSTFQFRCILNIETWFLHWKVKATSFILYSILGKAMVGCTQWFGGMSMTEVPVGRKDLLNVITYYFTVLQILFINITIALMRKKIKFLETVKLTERTMFLQNYLCLKSSYNLVQMASTSSPQLTPVVSLVAEHRL